jgi:hypothetical protein
MPEDTPHKDILDRHFYSAFIDQEFKDSLQLLEELVNYGTNLVPRAFASSDKEIKDIVIVSTLLKHAVAVLDGIHILTAKGATTSAIPLLRSVFEVSVYLGWILQRETGSRAMLYFVWDIRRQLFWALCLKAGSLEYTNHQKAMTDAPFGSTGPNIEDQIIDAQIELNQKKLATPECSAAHAEFEKRKKKSGRDVDWYVPGGVNHLREMARAVGKESLYQTMYSSFSNVTHGQVLKKHIGFSKDGFVFEPIRNLTDIEEIFRFSTTFALGIYRLILDTYRPAEIEVFNRKYVREWRGRFLSVKKVEYKEGTYKISAQNLLESR